MIPIGNDDTALDVRSLADIGAAVRAERTRRGLTQAELADMLGVGRRFLSDVEGGKKERLDAGLLLKVLLKIGYTVRLER